MTSTTRKKKLYSISVSALNEYIKCPRIYRKKYLDGAFPYQSTPYTSLGDSVHAILESYYTSGVWPQEKYDYTAKPADEKIKDVVRIMDGFISDKKILEAGSVLALTGGNLKDYQAYLLYIVHKHKYPETTDPLALVETHKQTHVALRGQLLNAGKISTEANIILDLWGRPITNPFDKDARTQVHIDLMVVGGTMAVNIDWKTGKFNDRFIDAPLKQAAFYAAHVLRRYPDVQTVHSLIIHPTSGNSGSLQRVYTRSSPEPEVAYQEALALHKLAAEYLSGGNPPALEEMRPNALCKAYCEDLTCEHNGKRV